MEEQYYGDRRKLRDLMGEHPDWVQGELARATGRSVNWVKKWRRRLREAEADDEGVLWGQSRARQTPPQRMAAKIAERILEIRDHPPDDLKRVPGPKAILYYLHHDPVYGAFPEALPRSTKTVWRLLKAHGRIVDKTPRKRQPLERPAPMVEWQLDFKDVASVPADPEGKQQHGVETLNSVDAGTSLLVEATVREDYNAETALEAVMDVLVAQGLPQRMTFDRDPRWVGSAAGRDFPSPFVRFCHCIGIIPQVCPPQQPDKNPFVERFNGTYARECLEVFRPRTLEEAQAVTAAFKPHYNLQRPNQALSCANQPPLMAFPELPTLPRLPEQVDPDAWLKAIDGETYVRKIRQDGTVVVDDRPYYIQAKHKGQYVMLRVNAAQRQFVVYLQGYWLKEVPIKGLYGRTMAWSAYRQAISQEAHVDWRSTQAQRALNRRRTLYTP